MPTESISNAFSCYLKHVIFLNKEKNAQADGLQNMGAETWFVLNNYYLAFFFHQPQTAQNEEPTENVSCLSSLLPAEERRKECRGWAYHKMRSRERAQAQIHT